MGKETQEKAGHRASFVFGLGALVMGIAIFSLAMHRVLIARASPSWPTAEGVVTCSEISERYPKKRAEFSPKIRYRYSVGGESYDGYRVSFFADGASPDRSPANAVLAKYPMGGSVRVFYAPDDPATSTLETTMGGSAAVFPAIGALLAALGLWVLGALCRGTRQRRKAVQDVREASA